MESGVTLRHKTSVYIEALQSELDRETAWLEAQGDADEDDSGWRRKSYAYIRALHEAIDSAVFVEVVGFSDPNKR